MDRAKSFIYIWDNSAYQCILGEGFPLKASFFIVSKYLYGISLEGTGFVETRNIRGINSQQRVNYFLFYRELPFIDLRSILSRSVRAQIQISLTG